MLCIYLIHLDWLLIFARLFNCNVSLLECLLLTSCSRKAMDLWEYCFHSLNKSLNRNQREVNTTNSCYNIDLYVQICVSWTWSVFKLTLSVYGNALLQWSTWKNAYSIPEAHSIKICFLLQVSICSWCWQQSWLHFSVINVSNWICCWFRCPDLVYHKLKQIDITVMKKFHYGKGQVRGF